MSGFVCIFSEVAHKFKEGGRLADKQAHRGEKLQGSHRGSSGGRRPNYRACRKFPAQKDGWLGHEQVGLEFLSVKPLAAHWSRP
jgi:hypothetical protein